MAAEEYEQDMRPLIKSFFPEEELEVVYTDEVGTMEKLQQKTEEKAICFVREQTHFVLFYVQEKEVLDKEEKQVDKSAIAFTEENMEVQWHKYYRDEACLFCSRPCINHWL